MEELFLETKKEIIAEVKLKIAEVAVLLQSGFGLNAPIAQDDRHSEDERFHSFIYNGSDPADIIINVNIVEKLPVIMDAEDVFQVYHFNDHKENWRLQKKDNFYIYNCPLVNKEQLMLVNNAFDRVNAYILPRKREGMVWEVIDIVYDFLQVLLINYLASRKKGVFVHSIGVKDSNGKGFLFAGKSGTGKSTTARIWHEHSGSMVLGDDRIAVRKLDSKFVIYGTPWHGEFDDYLSSRIESALLERLFFISHCSINKVERLSEKEAFQLLYPTLFPTFWDKGSLENIVSFCQDLVKSVPCFRLGFVNNKDIIDFVRKA